ncbi:phospholipase A2 inhibitor and Ly6/PLAUR domain-containing protein-like [Dendrobates tinctorius]|uniref:phospholipase A2 inhibitor and Ly6/PLAUR domain-containing protein-like n=1 Tax=Dendrobates tinctorius TaxID=92724 RepID=UPI003CCA5945
MKYFLIYLVFAIGEITIGKALKCEQCKADGQKDCSGPSVECKNEDDICVHGIEHNILDGDRRTTVHKGCFHVTTECNQIITVNTGRFQMKLYNKCCNTDHCNSGPIEMPLLNTTENGLYCKSCFVEGSYKCEKYESVACTCNQGDCIEFSGDATRPGDVEKKYAFAGCASKGVCVAGYNILLETSVGEVESLRCPLENIILPSEIQKIQMKIK